MHVSCFYIVEWILCVQPFEPKFACFFHLQFFDKYRGKRVPV